MTSLSDFTATRLLGGPEPLSIYAGKVVLVVNVASGCGLTPQYAGLETLWRDYRNSGLVVLGFPCNQFGGQESGSAEEIESFCTASYEVTFPMFEKVTVNGAGAHPLFEWLKGAAPGFLRMNSVKWNFTKFLIARDGSRVRRFGPNTPPSEIASHIETLMRQSPPAS